MKAARILVVTNGALCRNPRPLKEAETLAGANYDVTVLTVRNHAPSERLDVELMRAAGFRRETVDMIGGFSADRWGPLARRVLLRLARSLSERGWKTIASLGPNRELLRRARALPASLTIVHNEVPHWVGVRLTGDGRRVAADIEDWHSRDLLPKDRKRRPLEAICRTEAALLHRASYATTTSRAMAAALNAAYGGVLPRVVTNSFPLAFGTSRRAGPPAEPPSFFWFSQTLGPGRGLEAFIAAWSRARRPSRLVLLGEPQPGYADQLRSLIPSDRLGSLSFLGLVPPKELPDVIARHDIGLALEDRGIVSRDLTITNKILQYINAGLAIVASDTAGQREVLGHGPEAGMIVDLSRTEELTGALDRMIADPGALARRQEAARRLAEDHYCWEREAPRLIGWVAEAIEPS